MKRNIYGAAAAGAVAVAVLTLSACMVPQPPPGADQVGSQGWGRGGLQGQGPAGADPDAYFHRLSSAGQGG